MRGPSGGPLGGKLIALPESRELDRLAQLLEAEGAATLRCPLLAIIDAPDPVPIRIWLDQLSQGQFTDVVFLTGEGVRRLWALAGQAQMQARVKQALIRVRKITRGPKPARALHELGLSPDVSPMPHTSAGIMSHLEHERPHLAGRVFGLQLYGDDPGTALAAFLTSSEARVYPVSPYAYVPASHDDRVVEFIFALAAGTVDAIAFTSAPQVERLWQVAMRRELLAQLDAGLRRVMVAAVGPIVAAALTARGHTPQVVPTPQFFMRRLTEALVQALGTS